MRHCDMPNHCIAFSTVSDSGALLHKRLWHDVHTRIRIKNDARSDRESVRSKHPNVGLPLSSVSLLQYRYFTVLAVDTCVT